ncbi:hypothetical protein FHW96_002800 [Novosphingobium sp. SG751A]|uniref:DUF808 domain-containing protein n=1 Tax=Novosphingobium sp. SG751A TaxID=2587000 RepID=UPI0015518B97|nr:DUF808 domain-containing protein [Novosphingobium sp. SG751A]NOW46640.1 hypothetical protein [Novosphingobium sp. SG751A]
MSVGLIALLDDVAMIAKAAAASLDDMAAGVAQAGSKAAGVVIDDAAVTPAYVSSFTPDRELPVIARIARGSLFNKLVILLPLALALSALLPWAITPLLMLGGLFLCYEGAEKLLEKLGGEAHGETPEGPVTDGAAFEAARVKGAVRTDLILSAEIMAIALAEVADKPLVERAVILGIVGVGITVLVYGVVGLIVKADDIGLHLARGGSGLRRAIGRALVQGTPPLLTLLANVGTAAMLWVGGGILLHGAEQLGLAAPAHWQHGAAHFVEAAAGAAPGWIAGAGVAGIAGLVVGMIVAGALHGLPALFRRT